MYLRYGGWTCELNEAAVAISKEPLLAANGSTYGMKETWTIQGFAQADTQAALITYISLLEAAFSKNQQNLTLLTDAGAVARSMPGLSAIGSTHVLGGVSYPDNGASNAEFSTFRTWQVTIEGRYPLLGYNPGQILAWAEALSFMGGGPRFVHLQPLEGLPQKQETANATPYRVTQQGSAVGLQTWPIAPGPIWPEAEHRDRRKYDKKAPKRDGGINLIFTEFEVEWAYEFESAYELSGDPTRLVV